MNPREGFSNPNSKTRAAIVLVSVLVDFIDQEEQSMKSIRLPPETLGSTSVFAQAQRKTGAFRTLSHRAETVLGASGAPAGCRQGLGAPLPKHLSHRRPSVGLTRHSVCLSTEQSQTTPTAPQAPLPPRPPSPPGPTSLQQVQGSYYVGGWGTEGLNAAQCEGNTQRASESGVL